MSDSYQSVLIVGGGPAGIAAAIECINLGMPPSDIVIFEKGSASVQAIRQFYPDKKMTLANYKNLPTDTLGSLTSFPDMNKKETLDYFDRLIEEFELDYQLRSEVSKIERIGDRFQVLVNQKTVEAQFVIIAIGILGRPNKPGVKIPVSLKRKVFFDLTTEPIENCRVLVVGGGDTSAEYCEILVGQGCETTLIYRKPEITKMMPQNLETIKKLSSESKLDLQLSCEVESLEESGDGAIKVNFTNCRSQVFDRIVYAIGGTTPVNFLKTAGIKFTAAGWPDIKASGETNVENLFLAGDLAVGKTGGSIITAYNSSYLVAKEIMRKLSAPSH